MSGGTLNLSLLSRGVGEVHTNGHEKVDVYLEPEDYLNFSTQDDKYCPSSLQPNYPPSINDSQTTRSMKAVQKFRVPKTYSTRKGALLLFSEDLAQRYTEVDQLGAHNSPSGLHSQISLKTVEDLANSILKYGGQGHLNDRIYLKFVRAHRGTFERQFRPGFSAKRYLSTWTRTWDDAVFENVIKHGYITEKSMHQYSLSLPGLRRRLVYDDLSRMPEPYKLMKNMLMYPGSLSGYTFYSTPTQDFENQNGEPSARDLELAKSDKLQNIHVIKTKDKVQREVMYADLDRQSQQEVITDLLVKSAVHYALKKQEEVYKDSVIKALRRQQNGCSEEESEDGSVASSIQKFDMKEAVEIWVRRNMKPDTTTWDPDRVYWYFVVAPQHDLTLKGRAVRVKSAKKTFDTYQLSVSRRKAEKRVRERLRLSLSLLESQHGQLSFGGNLPDLDNLSHNTDRGAAFKGGLVSSQTTKHKARYNGSCYDNDSGSERWTDRRDSSDSGTSLTNLPVLPPIHHTLSPIKDLSRDASQHSLSLPPLVPALPDLGQDDTEEDRSRWKSQDISNTISKSLDKDNDRMIAGTVGHSFGQSESVAIETRSQGRRKSDAWIKGGEGHAVSMKGSRIMAPDGEIISVGGTILRGNGHSLDVESLNEGHRQQESAGASSVKAIVNDVKVSEPAENYEDKKKLKILPRIKQNKNTQRTVSDSGSEVADVTEHAIVGMLTNHAKLVAENVLSQPSSGIDLETDVKQAAEVWSQMHLARSLSKVGYVGEKHADVIDEVMRSRSMSSESSSADEYKSRIRKSLTIAVTKVAGLDPDSVSDDAEISVELLDALVNQRVAPDQIEVVTDSAGHTRIQPKVNVGENVRRLDVEHPVTSSLWDEPQFRDAFPVLYDHELPTEDLSADQVTEGDDSQQDETKETSSPEPDSLPRKHGTQSYQQHKITSSIVKKRKKIVPGSSASVAKDKKADGSKSKQVQAALRKRHNSKNAKNKEMPTEVKEEPFVVGMPKEKPTSSKPVEPVYSHKEAKKETKGKKGVKGKKKVVKQSQQQPAVQKQPAATAAVEPEEVQEVQRQVSPPQLTHDVDESRLSSPEMKSEDSESDYNFVRDQSSPEPEDNGEQGTHGQSGHQLPSPGPDDDDDKLDVEDEDDDETSKLRSISNREARAARRAAAAAKRREEVEHRRKLKEEQLKREKEEIERQIVLQKEMEEQRKKGEEERRLRKQQALEEVEKERMESEEAAKRRTLEAEKEKRAKEEYLRKLQEIKRKQQEEELRKRELMLQQQKEEEERKAAEELMLSKMALQERLEYERVKKEKEEEKQRKELEEKLQRAEEAKAAMEEAQRLAAEMARKQAELEARLQFNRSIQDETSRLAQSHSINRAFVFSYFELLQWLGLDIPEFELAKVAEY